MPFTNFFRNLMNDGNNERSLTTSSNTSTDPTSLFSNTTEFHSRLHQERRRVSRTYERHRRRLREIMERRTFPIDTSTESKIERLEISIEDHKKKLKKKQKKLKELKTKQNREKLEENYAI